MSLVTSASGLAGDEGPRKAGWGKSAPPAGRGAGGQSLLGLLQGAPWRSWQLLCSPCRCKAAGADFFLRGGTWGTRGGASGGGGAAAVGASSGAGFPAAAAAPFPG